MRLYYYVSLVSLIYLISGISSCENKDIRESKSIENPQINQEFTLEDTLIAHAVVLKGRIEGILYSQLLKKIRDKGVKRALDACSPNNNDDLKAFLNLRNIKSERFGLKKSEGTIENTLHVKFKEHGSPFTHVEDFDTCSIVYLGFSLKDVTCLKCHGKLNQDLFKPTLDKIRKEYPNYTSLGYSIGDYMGLWKTTFKKKKNH